MRIHVETCERAMPRSIRFDGRRIEIVEMLDQWLGENYRYVKVKGDDGNLYILRLDETLKAWELTMFQRRQEQSATPPRNDHGR